MNHSPAIPRTSRRTTKMVTLRDIAQELDISHVTVSLALRDHSRISADTRKRVQQKAEEMGYYAPSQLSGLPEFQKRLDRKKVATTLAWIEPAAQSRPPHRLEEFNLYKLGAREAARKQGFLLEEFTPTPDTLDSLAAQFRARNIRGLMVAPTASEVPILDWSTFPRQDHLGVCFRPIPQPEPFHNIASAQAANMILAYEQILRKGYRRIGYVGHACKTLFHAGYASAQQTHPQHTALPPLLFNEEKVDHQSRRLAEWMEQARPDAILTEQALLPAQLKQIGYSVPNDVALATMSLHDTPINAGIDQNPKEIGRTATETLISLLQSKHLGLEPRQRSILVHGHWQDGSMLPNRR